MSDVTKCGRCGGETAHGIHRTRDHCIQSLRGRLDSKGRELSGAVIVCAERLYLAGQALIGMLAGSVDEGSHVCDREPHCTTFGELRVHEAIRYADLMIEQLSKPRTPSPREG